MNQARRRWTPLWLPGILLACLAAALTLQSSERARVLEAASSVVGVLLPWAVALAVRARYPDRPLAPLLFTLAGLSAAQAFASSQNPALFTLARAARPVTEVALMWLMLAFPSGRLQAPVDRWLIGFAAATVLLLWLPGIMFSPRIPLPGPYVVCGADCPANLLFMDDRPGLAQAFLGSYRVVGGLALLAIATRLAWRLSQSSALMRRTLAPVLLASIARVLSVALFLATGAFGWTLMLSFWLVPAAIGLGLLRGRLWFARALQRLVSGQRALPDRHALRDVIADALDDPSLQIGYWLPEAGRWVDAGDAQLRLPEATDTRRAVRMIAGDVGQASVALVHDAALLEEPSLVDAVVGSMRLALTHRQLDAALQASRRDKALAVALERRRIERDLHDGAQQRLLALRMKVSVAQRLLDADPQRAASLLSEVGPDIDFALAELRDLAHGIVPSLLIERGLQAALAEVAQRFARPIDLELQPFERLDGSIEQAAYFCCVEALQNALKHAGDSPHLRLVLSCSSEALRFAVEDDGPGLPGGQAQGRGVHNMRQRLADLGGRLTIATRAEGGTRVQGFLPLAQGSARA